MNNRKKLIELFIYVLIVAIGIILLLTTNMKNQDHKTQIGGATSAIVSLK
jgi:competence protein ComGC